jgi:hypothetical protein
MTSKLGRGVLATLLGLVIAGCGGGVADEGIPEDVTTYVPPPETATMKPATGSKSAMPKGAQGGMPGVPKS